MNESIRRELLEIPTAYPRENLEDTYYRLLSPDCREQLADKLTCFLRPVRMADPYLTEDEKAYLLYQVLSQCLHYDHGNYEDDEGLLRFTYAGGLTSGKAVCMGIAELYTLMGTILGLQVQTVIGYGGDPGRKGGLHAWNQILLPNGSGRTNYHLDLTWDLASHAQVRGFEFYLKSDAYMHMHDHTWLTERYAPCPEDRCRLQIPKLRPAAVQFLCTRFKKMQQELSQAV